MRKNEYVLFLFCKKIKSWHGVCFINKCKMQKANKLKCVEIEIWMTKRCRTDFADIQNKKECGGNRQWQNHYLRNWAANTKGKGII